MFETLTCDLCGDQFQGVAEGPLDICPLHQNFLAQGHFAFIATDGTAALVRRDLLPQLGFEFEDGQIAAGCAPEVVAQLQGLAFSLAAQKHKLH
jgi:hypothetical protein